jgi:hypothetical protein
MVEWWSVLKARITPLSAARSDAVARSCAWFARCSREGMVMMRALKILVSAAFAIAFGSGPYVDQIDSAFEVAGVLTVQ